MCCLDSVVIYSGHQEIKTITKISFARGSKRKTAHHVCYIAPPQHQVMLPCRSEGKISWLQGALVQRCMLFGHQNVCALFWHAREKQTGSFVNVNLRLNWPGTFIKTENWELQREGHNSRFALPQPLITPKNALFESEAVQSAHELWSTVRWVIRYPVFEHVWPTQSKGLKREFSL